MPLKKPPEGFPFLCGEPTSISILDSAKKASSGTWKLADFQRGVVWEWKQKKSLLESIYLGIPMGSLYIWDVKDQQNPAYRKLTGVTLEKEFKTKGLIIDGQQRLTFLARYFQSSENLKDFGSNKEGIIVINMRKSEGKRIPSFEKYQLSKEDKETLKELKDEIGEDEDLNEVKQEKLFELLLEHKDKKGKPEELLWTQYILGKFEDSEVLKEFLKENGVKDKFAEIGVRLFAAIKKRHFGLHMINKVANRDDCVHIYERVNKSGRKLDDMDYVEAMLTCHCPGFYDDLNKFEEKIQSRDFKGKDFHFKEVKRKVILTAILYDLYNTTSRQKAMENGLEVYETIIPGEKNSATAIKKAIGASLTRVKDAFEQFRELMATHLILRHSGGFKEKPQVVAVSWLIKWGENLEDADARKLVAWFIHANMFNHYSGKGTDDKTDADCKLVANNKSPWVRLRKNIKVHREIELDEIKIKLDHYEHRDFLSKGKDISLSNRSFMNSLNWTVANYNEAKDWISGASLVKTFEIDVHHIHPKSKLENRSNRTKHHIANKCFISEKTNRKVIKDKLPSVYIPHIEDLDKSRLTAQQIPGLKDKKDFDKLSNFIDKRKQLLVDETNRIIDRLKEGKDPAITGVEKSKDIASEIKMKEGQCIERKLRFFTQEKCIVADCKQPAMGKVEYCYKHSNIGGEQGEQALIETTPIKSSMVREIVAFLNSKGGDLFVGVRNSPDDEDPTPGLDEEMSSLYPNEDDPGEKYIQKINDYVRTNIAPKSAHDNNVTFTLLKENTDTGEWLNQEQIKEAKVDEEYLGNTILWVEARGCLEAAFEGVRQQIYQKFDNKMQVKRSEKIRWIRNGEQVYDADEDT